MIDFVGAAERRTSDGLAQAAAMIGCEIDALLADVQVEAASSGFDAARRPKALFEPHLFYRHLSGAAREAAVLRGLAYRKWGTHPYPADSYPRLIQAMRIDPEAALISTSWGLPQILGANHEAAGYPTVAAMVDAFVIGGEDEHLAAMARFIVADPRLCSAIRTHDWVTFAKLYNGPATKGYDVKLVAAYRRALAMHPATINANIAATDARASSRAKVGGGTAAMGLLVAIAPAANLAGHEHLDWATALVGMAVAVGVLFVLRAVSFGNKSAAFTAASLVAGPASIGILADPKK